MTSGFSGHRVFANRRVGFAIGNIPPGSGETYPLTTSDGGKSWRTAGPVLHIPAAQAAVVVLQAGVISPRIWFACCGFDSVVDVTPDAGKHWWIASLPGDVLTVYPGPGLCGRLIAVVQPVGDARRQPVWIYASAQGRRWAYVANQFDAKRAC